jgi:hypothetical protein
MTFKNTSRYPKDEVRRLVEFALRNIDHREVAVHVKNRRNAVSGMAYRNIPWISPFRRNPKLRYLITVSVGAESTFPFTARYRRRKSDKDTWSSGPATLSRCRNKIGFYCAR